MTTLRQNVSRRDVSVQTRIQRVVGFTADLNCTVTSAKPRPLALRWSYRRRRSGGQYHWDMLTHGRSSGWVALTAPVAVLEDMTCRIRADNWTAWVPLPYRTAALPDTPRDGIVYADGELPHDDDDMPHDDDDDDDDDGFVGSGTRRRVSLSWFQWDTADTALAAVTCLGTACWLWVTCGARRREPEAPASRSKQRGRSTRRR